MSEAIELYRKESYKTVYTSKELGIPALEVLGWYSSNIARPPLVNHFHKNTIEITLLLQGTVVYFVNGIKYQMMGGDILVTPADLLHDTGLYPTDICEKYWFQLCLDEASFLFLDSYWALRLKQSLKALEPGIYRRVGISRKYMADMFYLLSSESQNSKFQGISMLINTLYGIIGNQPEKQKSPSSDIQKAVDFISANCCDYIDLESLAKKASLSVPRFKQKFFEQIGMPPRMFINSKKVEMAQKLLIKGVNITDIAFELGFNSSSYFSMVFRKFTTVSPSEFIKKSSAS